MKHTDTRIRAASQTLILADRALSQGDDETALFLLRQARAWLDGAITALEKAVDHPAAKKHPCDGDLKSLAVEISNLFDADFLMALNDALDTLLEATARGDI